MKIQIGNGFLAYDKIGKGIPLLFIHGYPLSRKIWTPQMESLSDLATLISVDLRGHGESFAYDGPYSMELLAEDCKKVLEDININQPVLVCGLSMGGYVTMALYRNYPHLIKGLILTSTRAGADSPEAKASREASIKKANDNGSSYIADNMIQKIVAPQTSYSKPDLVRKIHAIMAHTSIQGIVGALHGMMNRSDSTSLLSQISCPTLIIHGTDDQLIPIKEAELMHSQIPNSQMVRIVNAGHLPNLEQPDVFNQALSDFIASLV
jgi:3-oxoadipate enol-lactonase